ncbi:hypothetical protein SCHPADRAFT_855784 [Schizopora paradoxa]|uniref:PH domain-containing protein n=1 Tax=Schizopora paradoxa TaxID=27342 RepID=A0A0H2RHL8_9AGAM|nr:hypothetical protein SCHPADRAFT_855784 [Schizopora paradoxa]
MPPSPGHRTRSDTMKDNILKESTAGWSNTITPLRIAKRETVQHSSNDSSKLSPSGAPIARRSSNSYKHVFSNNLVSKSPFKSHIPQSSSRSTPRSFFSSPKSPRKVSGEKRPRPDVLVKQAEVENQQRARELGFKRRQSKAFQGMVEKEPVSKSPFRRLLSPTEEHAPASPIRVDIPRRSFFKTDDDTTSLDTESESVQDSEREGYHTPMTMPVDSEWPSSRIVEKKSPLPASISPTRSALSRKTPDDFDDSFRSSFHRSPTPTRQLTPKHESPLHQGRSPTPSAMQGSPIRSSLAQRPRLMGPRSRSFSGSPADTPRTLERRKTVTFDERCDVVEFDRESHEDRVFDSDEEDFYGGNNDSQDNSYDSLNENNTTMTQHVSPPPTHGNQFSEQSPYDAGNDSISGLVDSMLMETSAFSAAEPMTPDSHSNSFTFSSRDPDLMTGGEENGVPHGRTHHSDRVKMHQQEMHFDGPRLPGAFDNNSFEVDERDEPSFSSISLSTPPQAAQVPRTPVHSHKPDNGPVSLAPDTEVDEVGIPYGRTHHADRARDAHQGDPEVEQDVQMLPPSPSPAKRPSTEGERRQSHSREHSVTMLPKFELGINFNSKPMFELGIEKSFSEDVFGGSPPSKLPSRLPPMRQPEPEPERVEDEYDYEFEQSVLSNTSIASFHEFPPHALEALTRGNDEAGEDIDTEDQVVKLDSPLPKAIETDIRSQPSLRTSTSRALPTPPSGPPSGQNSLSNSLSRSPLISREDIQRRLDEQRAGSVSGSVSPSTPSSSMPPASAFEQRQQGRIPRPTLEERLKRAVSPLAATSPRSESPNPSSRIPVPVVVSPAPSPVVAPPSPIPSPAIATSTPDKKISSATSSTLQIKAHSHDAEGRPLAATPLSASFDFSQSGVGEMRSALDRLVDEVSVNTEGMDDDEDMETEEQGGERSRGSATTAPMFIDRSFATSDGDASMAETELITEESHELLAGLKSQMQGPPVLPPVLERMSSAPAAPTAPSRPSTFTPASVPASRVPSTGSIPPQVPAKDGMSARQQREEMIREKRREQKLRDSGEFFIPPRRDLAGKLVDVESSPASRRHSGGRPSKRRSLSTGDAEDLGSSSATAQRRVSILKNQLGGVLGMAIEDEEDQLTDSIERELQKMDKPKNKSYVLNEHQAVVYASSSQEESIAHMADVGDVDSGKAWRTVRRPSDMNEYSRQIKELRSQEKPGKTHGKVFVKVLRIEGMKVPLPLQATYFSVTLNNGIHFVTTPDGLLTRDAKVEQEFELIEHSKLEFTLTLKVRRDTHIVHQIKSLHVPPPPPPVQVAPPAPVKSGGMRSFFGGSKKSKAAPQHTRSHTEPIIPTTIDENLARYLKQDGMLARAFVAFKDVAPRCDTQLFEGAYPLIGQRLEVNPGGSGTTMAPRQVGEIVLQMFRLPPLPGIPQNELPQSLEECYRGLRNVAWHKATYHEGVLTQLGGDCSTWRRRQLRVIGGNLVAFNDVTKRATATIDLKKAISIEDDQENARSPQMRMERDIDDFDAMYGVERSFRLVFPNKQEIMFFADTDEEKAIWLDVLRKLVGHIPPNPLWAEMVWQRQSELQKRPSNSGSSTSSSSSASSKASGSQTSATSASTSASAKPSSTQANALRPQNSSAPSRPSAIPRKQR